MSIVVDCACGKRLKTTDTGAGRKVKCPHCGRVLLVPTIPANPGEPGSSVLGTTNYSPLNAPEIGADGDREPWFTLLSIEFGPTKTITTVVLILVLAGVAIWCFTRSSGGPTGGSGGQVQKPQPTVGQYFDAMTAGRRKANRIVVANNMRQLLAIMQIYVQSHNGQFPDTLEALVAAEPSAQPLLIDPHNPAAPAFIYVKPQGPAGDQPAAGNVPILYEANGGKPDPQGVVGFADGQVQLP